MTVGGRVARQPSIGVVEKVATCGVEKMRDLKGGGGGRKGREPDNNRL